MLEQKGIGAMIDIWGMEKGKGGGGGGGDVGDKVSDVFRALRLSRPVVVRKCAHCLAFLCNSFSFPHTNRLYISRKPSLFCLHFY